MTFSLRSQIAMLWWSIVFGVIFGCSLGFLLHMIPPPHAAMTADEIKSWYDQHDTSIKLGAMVSSWTSAFLVPFFLVMGTQIRRHETGAPVWSGLTIVGGALTAIFLVLPPIALGAAAYTPGRSADATAIMHEFAVFMLVTTDQFFVFPWVALIVISLRPNTVRHSPFPRWYGYLNIWLLGLFETGAIAFTQRKGLFSWEGLFVFWSPFGLFGVWCFLTIFLLLRSLKRQLAESVAGLAAGPEPAAEDAALLI